MIDFFLDTRAFSEFEGLHLVLKSTNHRVVVHLAHGTDEIEFAFNSTVAFDNCNETRIHSVT
jgi:hypothetical protein